MKKSWWLIYSLLLLTPLVSAEQAGQPGGKSDLKDMVQVPAGEFWMGCNESVDKKKCGKDEKPYHKVYLDTFYIDKYDVTVDQYSACVKAGRCKEAFNGSSTNEHDPNYYYNWGKSGRGNHPINGVDWNDAKGYCEFAGKRLPTEAEWEKAARGTDGRTYPWGNQEPGPGSPKYGNFADESVKRVFENVTILEGYDDGYIGTSPVESFPAGASPYGAMDMLGNVCNWVADWYDKKYYDSSPSRNPQGPASGTHRVNRGGSWYYYPLTLHTSARYLGKPTSRDFTIGFRCARTP